MEAALLVLIALSVFGIVGLFTLWLIKRAQGDNQ
jgi:hypothetical protein